MLRKTARSILAALGASAGAAFLAASADEADAIAYVGDPRPALRDGAVPIDARALEACRTQSLAGARCLPASDFLGPHRRLASERDILWLLGTAGLAGDEHVLVVGNEPRQRDFVAGVLYLAGQRRISVLTQPVARGAGLDAESLAPGEERATTRRQVFRAPMRDGLVVLRDELAAMVRRSASPGVLDGRSETEYWGETVRGLRGGHVPGAQLLSATVLRSAVAAGRALVPGLAEPVAYGHDPFEGIAYLTLLRAGAGVRARLYVAGWSDWAAHTALPADSVTYADATQRARPAPRTAARPSWGWLAAAFLGGGALVAGGFALGRWSAGRWT